MLKYIAHNIGNLVSCAMQYKMQTRKKDEFDFTNQRWKVCKSNFNLFPLFTHGIINPISLCNVYMQIVWFNLYVHACARIHV